MESNKQTYTKVEILQKLGIQPYIMTLWEKEFDIQSVAIDEDFLYSSQDLLKLKSIKALLYEKYYTLDAAKKYLREHPDAIEDHVIPASPLTFESKVSNKSQLPQKLAALQKQLMKLRDLL